MGLQHRRRFVIIITSSGRPTIWAAGKTEYFFSSTTRTRRRRCIRTRVYNRPSFTSVTDVDRVPADVNCAHMKQNFCKHTGQAASFLSSQTRETRPLRATIGFEELVSTFRNKKRRSEEDAIQLNSDQAMESGRMVRNRSCKGKTLFLQHVWAPSLRISIRNLDARASSSSRSQTESQRKLRPQTKEQPT